jgi:ribosome biogenesis GTPase
VAARRIEPGLALSEAVLARQTRFSRPRSGTRHYGAGHRRQCRLCLRGVRAGWRFQSAPAGTLFDSSLVRESGAGAIVVLDKGGPCESIAERVDAVTRLGAGTQVIAKCAQATVEPLRVLVRGRTVALLGSSGAGKSTIANRLLGEERQATAGGRPADSRGRHSTTNRMLLPLPGGGAISDNPGMRELQLWASQESLEGLFEDIAEAAGHCRFRDCAHQNEPGCALQGALERGEIDPRAGGATASSKPNSSTLRSKAMRMPRPHRRSVGRPYTGPCAITRSTGGEGARSQNGSCENRSPGESNGAAQDRFA